MEREYQIIDTTLREGEQAPGVLFSIDEKRRIVDGLCRIGVGEAELGISSGFHTCVPELIAYCRSRHPGLRLSLWSRCREEDILFAAGLRPDILSLSIPVSDIHLEKRLNKSRSWACDTMSKAISLAGRLGLPVAIGFEDATRSDVSFLLEMARTAEKLGVARIRLADTLGLATPREMADLVSLVVAEIPRCHLAVHTHNDFGMATANGLAALQAGAGSVDTTVMGLGERTGCARLEEIVGYLALVKGDRRFNAGALKPLAAFVAEAAGRVIEGSRPIVGDDIFTCDTGLHLQGLRSDPRTYEPFAPEEVGGCRRLLLGPKGGRRSIAAHLAELVGGLEQPPSEATVQAVRDAAGSLRRPLTDEELRRFLVSAEAAQVI